MQSKSSSGRLNLERERHDRLFCGFAEDDSLPQPLIVCLQMSDVSPSFAAPMKRDPLPPIGQTLAAEFADGWKQAVALNPAVHDGAVMTAPSAAGDFVVVGWSYRLFAPQAEVAEHKNRGSAFNSCLTMSVRNDVAGLYLVTRGECWRFSDGFAELILAPSQR